jgi:multidrug efflux system membrane fusion protein
VGARSGDRVAILDGVKEGEQIVLEGTDRLRSGAKVRIVGADPAKTGPSGK